MKTGERLQVVLALVAGAAVASIGCVPTGPPDRAAAPSRAAIVAEAQASARREELGYAARVAREADERRVAEELVAAREDAERRAAEDKRAAEDAAALKIRCEAQTAAWREWDAHEEAQEASRRLKAAPSAATIEETAAAETWISAHCRLQWEPIFEDREYVDAQGFVRVEQVQINAEQRMVCPANTPPAVQRGGGLTKNGAAWERMKTRSSLPENQVARTITVPTRRRGGPPVDSRCEAPATPAATPTRAPGSVTRSFSTTGRAP